MNVKSQTLKHVLEFLALLTIAGVLIAAQVVRQPSAKADVKPALPAQSHSQPAASVLPQLSTAERIALESCEKQKQEAQKQWQDALHQEQAILVEFSTAHPGYHLNGITFAVEADTPKPALPANK